MSRGRSNSQGKKSTSNTSRLLCNTEEHVIQKRTEILNKFGKPEGHQHTPFPSIGKGRGGPRGTPTQRCSSEDPTRNACSLNSVIVHQLTFYQNKYLLTSLSSSERKEREKDDGLEKRTWRKRLFRFPSSFLSSRYAWRRFSNSNDQ